MLIYPAIDLYAGQAVRLQRGDYARMTVYSDRPETVAADFAAQGARQLHLIDLEGAKNGGTPNLETIVAVKKSSGLFCQVGGGIRSEEAIETYLEAGVNRVIIGSKAVEDPKFITAMAKKYGSSLAVSIDAKGDVVATRGWVDGSDKKVLPFAQSMLDIGINTLVYTDISRDGMLTGPNFEMLSQLQQLPFIRLIASGGMSSIDDLKKLQAMGVYGAITGKALYEGKITMAEIRALGGM